MTDSDRGLPEFSKPPVVETVLGVEFAPIEGFGLLELGMLRDRWSRFSAHRIMPPLPSLIADGTTPGPGESERVFARIVPSPSIRVWMVNSDESRLVQVQETRLLYNWRSVPSANEYPRYSQIRMEFGELWGELVRFLDDRGCPRPQLRAFEVTYVNHLEKAREYRSFDDIGAVFPMWTLASREFLPKPVTGGFRAVFPIPEVNGALEVKLEQALRHLDLQEILQLELSVRGILQAADFEHALNALDVGHEWIVRGFADLTSDQMHALWERSQ